MNYLAIYFSDQVTGSPEDRICFRAVPFQVSENIMEESREMCDPTLKKLMFDGGHPKTEFFRECLHHCWTVPEKPNIKDAFGPKLKAILVDEGRVKAVNQWFSVKVSDWEQEVRGYGDPVTVESFQAYLAEVIDQDRPIKYRDILAQAASGKIGVKIEDNKLVLASVDVDLLGTLPFKALAHLDGHFFIHQQRLHTRNCKLRNETVWIEKELVFAISQGDPVEEAPLAL